MTPAQQQKTGKDEKVLLTNNVICGAPTTSKIKGLR